MRSLLLTVPTPVLGVAVTTSEVWPPEPVLALVNMTEIVSAPSSRTLVTAAGPEAAYNGAAEAAIITGAAHAALAPVRSTTLRGSPTGPPWSGVPND
ncbi:hypothetical protein [Nocardioides sp.]|uniref:hypothetical protein n=1 Tax=Nocardioides sp. TaxID=35761 RepID=UPI002B279762|nr:hypothetical protein [Nocardioides sp.]